MTVLEKGQASAPRTSTPRVWTFAGCVLDESSLELKVGGRIAEVERKQLEVLLHLLRHAGEVVTKDELAEAVWPGRIITDSTLTKTVAVLRAALGDTEQLAIKTVHGYGYRLMAPVSVQAVARELPPARFDFKPGENPPLRPLWKLTQRLGSGGHGEVWLAHHAKTKEPRVFKFAEGGGALTGLKREVTLNRLLREALLDRNRYLRLLDWNFEAPPFFVESEYAAGGNLQAWAETAGGWTGIALATRLELLAQAAEALAAAHSVGVLHKDLKPANILVVEKDGEPQIRLADFGSGGILDPAALEALGITRIGFTQTVHLDGTTSGTPLYLAPEVIAGQPFTVQSDIYALGVMLYQLVAGDTRKALAPGWEKDVADELLRKDIAQTAAGDPADRLGDAALLAQRLRTLEARRRELEEARTSRLQAERSQRLRRELKRLRAVAAVLLVLTGAAATAGVIAYKARNEAQRAVTTAHAVNQFLNQDLLARADPGQGATKDLTVRQLIDAAAAAVDARFADQPDAAAQVHATLGEAYLQMGEQQRAQAHLERAAALYSSLYGPTAVPALEARGQLARVLFGTGRRDESCAMMQEVRTALEAQLAEDDDRRLAMRASRIHCLDDLKEHAQAVPEINAIVAAFEQRGMTDDRLYGSVLTSLTIAHFDGMDFTEAEKAQRKLLGFYVRTKGERHIATARQRANLANSLTFTGRLAEADAELTRALEDGRNWMGAGAADAGNMKVIEAILRLEQARFGEAEALARHCLEGELGQQKRGGFRLAGLYVLGEAVMLQGRPGEAVKIAEKTAKLARELKMIQFHELPARAHWADALTGQGKLDAAEAVLGVITPEDVAAVPPQNVFYALFRRAQGLLYAKQGQEAQARAALQESLDIYLLRYGPDHWRTRRAKEELSRSRPQ